MKKDLSLEKTIQDMKKETKANTLRNLKVVSQNESLFNLQMWLREMRDT